MLPESSVVCSSTSQRGARDAAFLSFLVFYALCMAVTWVLYARTGPAATRGDTTHA